MKQESIMRQLVRGYIWYETNDLLKVNSKIILDEIEKLLLKGK